MPGAAIQPSWSSSTTSFGKPSALPSSTPASSTSSAPTNIPPSGFTFSSLSSSSTKSFASFDPASTSYLNSFTPESGPTHTSSTTTATTAASFSFSDFKFGQSMQTVSPPTSMSTAFSFGKPSTALPSFNQPSMLHQQEGQQSLSRGKFNFPFSPSVFSVFTPVIHLLLIV
jgi:hypothetical protein